MRNLLIAIGAALALACSASAAVAPDVPTAVTKLAATLDWMHSTKKTGGLGYSVGQVQRTNAYSAMVALGATWPAVVVPPPPPGQTSPWLGTFQASYTAAVPGSTVTVPCGSYGSQQITGQNAGQVTFEAATAHCARIVGTLIFGANSGNPATGNPPSYLTLDGIDVNGQTVAYYNGGTQAHDLTVSNAHFWSLSGGPLTSAGLGLTNWRSINNLMLSHDEFGPWCCNGDLIYSDMPYPTAGNAVPVNYTVADSLLHDAYDSCKYVPAAITGAYGPCNDQGFGDCQTCGYDHDDALQLWGGVTGFKFLRNTISLPGNDDQHLQGLFLECGDASGNSRPITCTNVDVENLTITEGPSVTDDALSIGNHYAGTAGIAGQVTVTGVVTNGYAEVFGLAPGATLTQSGNQLARCGGLLKC